MCKHLHLRSIHPDILIYGYNGDMENAVICAEFTGTSEIVNNRVPTQVL